MCSNGAIRVSECKSYPSFKLVRVVIKPSGVLGNVQRGKDRVFLELHSDLANVDGDLCALFCEAGTTRDIVNSDFRPPD